MRIFNFCFYFLIGVIAYSCSGNPVESKAYKKMIKNHEDQKMEYYKLMGELNEFNHQFSVSIKVMGKKSDQLTDDLRNAAMALNNAMDQGKAAKEKHQASLSEHKARVDNHVNLKMEAITTDFEEINLEQQQMIADLNGALDMIRKPFNVMQSELEKLD